MNGILKRKVFFARVRFTSPLNISSGEDEWTDADILRDCDGNPFVPGSSLAGAMRAYLEKEKNMPCMMGYSDRNDTGKMSSLFISDMVFDKNIVSGVRDGVALDENKITKTGSKYDMEILEGRAEGCFYMELAVRERDMEREDQWEQELASVFQGIQKGEIRLGKKKTRGFGRFELLSLSVKTYQKENYLDYADAYEESTWADAADEKEAWLHKVSEELKMFHIIVPLRLKGGISIRQYAARKNEPDFVHLTDHQMPVIPGSSFAGAIRHRTENILRELMSDKEENRISVDRIINRVFGYVKNPEIGEMQDEIQACASDIIISESEIRDARFLTMVRTGISRFEAAVRDGALYKERTCVDGRTELEITVRKDQRDDEWIMGILLLALKDLQNGFLAVGGQTAIGRGVFSPDGPILIDGEQGREEEYIRNAFRRLVGNGGE